MEDQMDRARAPRRAGRLGGCLGLAVVLALIPVPPRLSAAAAPDVRAAAAMQQFLDRAMARQYVALRRLEASGVGRRGWLDAETEFSAASGFSYRVTAEGGSGPVRSRVLRALLDEEQRMIARGDSAGVAISAANYQLTPEGLTEEGFAVVDLRPLRKDTSLIAGRMLLSADGSVACVEGRLVKNPSWWTTRVDVVRAYRRVNGVLMPVSLETRARLRLFGSSSLRMTYRYAQIDERPVVEEAPDEARGEPTCRAPACSLITHDVDRSEVNGPSC